MERLRALFDLLASLPLSEMGRGFAKVARQLVQQLSDTDNRSADQTRFLLDRIEGTACVVAGFDDHSVLFWVSAEVARACAALKVGIFASPDTQPTRVSWSGLPAIDGIMG